MFSRNQQNIAFKPKSRNVGFVKIHFVLQGKFYQLKEYKYRRKECRRWKIS